MKIFLEDGPFDETIFLQKGPFGGPFSRAANHIMGAPDLLKEQPASIKP